jgi:phosphoglucomutase
VEHRQGRYRVRFACGGNSPSGTEDIYKIYAESFRGEDHLTRIVDEAQSMVDSTLEAQAATDDGA